MNAEATVDSDEQADQRDVLRFGPGDEQHAHRDRDQHRRRPEVGLEDHEHGGRADEQQPAEEPCVADLVAAFVGEVGREHEQRRELRHLGGLEVERTEVERDSVAAVDLADDEQQRQDHQREAVEERRPLLQPLVVDRHDREHHDRGDDPEHDLAGDERVRVLDDSGARRREHDEAARHRQHRLRQQEHPVDVAARVAGARADVAETAVGPALEERHTHAA